ncbi:hypothetical protein I7G59_09640 [Sinorhizobium meliloti]|uniref:hypothetical protein n=1 Tax=Rhizobium meliloti TaxID=382 RepID=UPI002380421A|nr:hypothetical protein [Sinorhizobium meliloti]MDE3797588.1 hypothetical protein [Sinorhizobium meliloti]
MEFKEETFTEMATPEETLADFRKRMVAMAVSDDVGIVSYIIDGEVLSADFPVKDGEEDRLATDALCEFRRKVVGQ